MTRTNCNCPRPKARRLEVTIIHMRCDGCLILHGCNGECKVDWDSSYILEIKGFLVNCLWNMQQKKTQQ